MSRLAQIVQLLHSLLKIVSIDDLKLVIEFARKAFPLPASQAQVPEWLAGLGISGIAATVIQTIAGKLLPATAPEPLLAEPLPSDQEIFEALTATTTEDDSETAKRMCAIGPAEIAMLIELARLLWPVSQEVLQRIVEWIRQRRAA
jgi:hypothetical protein